MALYRYADLTISSTLSIPELSVADIGQTDNLIFTYRYPASTPPEPKTAEWIHDWKNEVGVPTLLLARTCWGYLLRFPALADFHILANSRSIEVWALPETTEATLRHLILEQVLPRLVAHQHRVVLHAGASRVGDRAIAFVGPTGSGKSTLAASLYRAGYPLLSDDALILDQPGGGVLVCPTYSGLRLWPNAVDNLFMKTPAFEPMAQYSSKLRVDIGVSTGETVASSWLPLAALFVLESAIEVATSSVSIAPMPQRQACMALIANGFQLDVTDKRRAAAMFADASKMVAELPTFTLRYPRDFARLPEVHAAILEACRSDTKVGR